MPKKNQNTEPVLNESVPSVDDAEMKMPEQTFGQAPEAEKPSVLGAMLVALIVVLLLVLGGLYLWSTTLNQPAPIQPVASRPTPEENNEPESTNAEAAVETFEVVSPSDEISAIEADLEATNFDDLDAELNAIEAELDAALE